MSSKSLVQKVSGFIVRTAKRVAYEFSYYTGMGWNYGPEDGYFDGLSRELQRNGTFPNGTPYVPFSKAWKELDRRIREGAHNSLQ